MEKVKRIISSALLLILIATLFTACGKGDKVSKTTLYIDKKGKLTEAIVEGWDTSLYNEKDLEKYIDKEIDAYEASNKDSSVKLKKFKVEDKKIRVIITYDSIKSYSQFNKVTAFDGTIKQAQEQGYLFEGEFVSTDGKPSITVEQLDGSSDYYAVILSEKQEVFTDFKILYASTNVKIEKDGKKAVISDEDMNSPVYLIYKK